MVKFLSGLTRNIIITISAHTVIESAVTWWSQDGKEGLGFDLRAGIDYCQRLSIILRRAPGAGRYQAKSGIPPNQAVTCGHALTASSS